MLATGMAACLANPDVASKSGFDLEEVERLFLKLA